MSDRPAIVAPTDLVTAGANVGGAQLFIVADLPEGGFLQIVPGDNPLAQAMPGPQLPRGCMLAVVPAEMAVHLRAQMVQLRAAQAGINQGAKH